MRITITHVLLITPYEASLLVNPHNWDEVIAQDFTEHILYCNDTRAILLKTNNIKTDVEQIIKTIKNVLQGIGCKVDYEQQIIVATTEEELNKYFH